METYYDVFHRTWWKYERQASGLRKLVPHAGHKTYLARHVTFDSAKAIAAQYNITHVPGALSRKAEIERA